MYLKPKNLSMSLLIAILFILSTGWLMQCSKDEEPEIVGCNSVKYKGHTYTNLGCAQGIRSFDVTITQEGHSASFHIECSNGCISSVKVTDGKSNKTITGPCGCSSTEK